MVDAYGELGSSPGVLAVKRLVGSHIICCGRIVVECAGFVIQKRKLNVSPNLTHSFILKPIMEDISMEKTVEMLEARINLLRQRDPVVNANIIRKLERKIRHLRESSNQSS